MPEPGGPSRRPAVGLIVNPIAGLGGRAASAHEALHEIAAHAVSRPVLVDPTAEETGDLLLKGYGDPYLVTERLWLLQRELRSRGWQIDRRALAASEANGEVRVIPSPARRSDPQHWVYPAVPFVAGG